MADVRVSRCLWLLAPRECLSVVDSDVCALVRHSRPIAWDKLRCRQITSAGCAVWSSDDLLKTLEFLYDSHGLPPCLLFGGRNVGDEMVADVAYLRVREG